MSARATLVAIAALLLASALAFAHPKPSGGPVFRDFEAYYAGGATWRYGTDPYSRDLWRTERTLPAIVPTRDELLPFVGPPFGLPLWDGFARLPWAVATVGWALVLGASFIALVAAGVLAGGTPVGPLRLGAAACVAAAFGPITSAVGLGQVALPACAAVALAPFALAARRSVAATLLTTLLASLQPNVALALVARIANARSALAIGGGFVVAVLGSALALGRLGGLAHYVDVLARHASAERYIAIQTTVGAVARALGASPHGSAAIALAVAAAALIGVTLQCLRGGFAPNDRLLLACAALPLAWPFAHEHDFALAFVPALAVAARARGATWYVGAFAAVLLGVDWLGLAQRPSGATFEVFRALAAGLALATLAPSETGAFDRRRCAVAGVAFAVALIAPYAAAHPIAVWPDALPLDFHVPAGFDAAQTWAAEQSRAGIARIGVVDGLLRALSLAGCAGVWLAASIALRRTRPEEVTVRSRPPAPPDPARTVPATAG